MRCFVGLPLSQEYQNGLDIQRTKWGPRFSSPLTWTRPGNWHITLAFLGEVDESIQSTIVDALSGVAFAPFTFQAGGAGVFPPQGPPRVLWVGAQQGGIEVAGLAKAVQSTLEPLGFEPDSRPFTTHLTLARARRGRKRPGKGKRANKQSREGGFEKTAGGDPWRECIAGVGAAEWPAIPMDRFVLWRSHLSESGPRYEPLAIFPATGPSDNPE
ncbi:RNA 2',3'-cyclic phosphodiesterase [Oceanidesulfovibrio indonesiensis]|uniref:RNA 2',3'-cyclic phosphodiesterase n=1 Tax=Oceanidesulfovibrio indonesiensis TaxID=54767 RepID=A0A7M3MBB4_9BACT|nr:RNA 2',3'-cyclic phosphodiesterase [Oceanidesulfovibrio indonesiensis]TVM15401.1 RNA 2',3'-cyclic phosphodiesterase [Oceanidesulfovibrio indonesiensis]